LYSWVCIAVRWKAAPGTAMPQQQNLTSAFAGRTTPSKGKSAAKGVAEKTTPEDPKKRKAEEVAGAKAEEKAAKKPAVRPAAEAQTASQAPTTLQAAGTDKQSGKATAAAGGAVGESGPYSLWLGPPGEPQYVASPDFHPQRKEQDFPQGKPIGFYLVSKALAEIEDLKGTGQGSRKKMTVILTNVFRILLYSRPEDLVPVIYILSNKVAPDYEESELGVGDGLVMKVMCESFGTKQAQITSKLASGEAKDFGEVALLSRQAQKVLMLPPKLTIAKVFSEMKAIASTKGKDSQTAKKDKIKKMLVASRDEEAKFIVRLMQAKLRIGIQIPTVLQALAAAFVLTRPRIEGTPAVSDTRQRLGGTLSDAAVEEKMVSMEAAVKQAFSEMPNLDKMVAAMMEGRDGSNLHEVCHIGLGIPVKPMLAKPAKGIGEVAERLTGKRFTGEWKYDGERAQIHVLSRDNIHVYSRNSENMTEKYPDVIQVVKDCLCEGIESCIIDAELVAFDQTTEKILPFQVLSTRGRKNIVVEDIKVNVCLYPFDCMLLNGSPLVTETLEHRRSKLWTILRETKGKVKFATYRNFDALNEEDIQEFLDESIAGSCEGLMLKTLTENATYAPSKRSLNWLKLKKDYLDGMADSIDVVPIGAYYGKGKRTGAYGAFLLAIYDHENEEYQTVCKAGTGFSDEDLVTHYQFYKERTLLTADPSFNVSDKMKPDKWLEPCQVWEIRAADLSISPVHTSAFGVKAESKGIGLRFPRFLRIRDDKGPEQSTGPDQIVEMFEAQASVGGGAAMDDDDC